MPFYRITIFMKYSKKPLKGIRSINTHNPDIAYNMVQQKVYTTLRPTNILKIDVVMLPKQSEEVKQFLARVKMNKNIYL